MAKRDDPDYRIIATENLRLIGERLKIVSQVQTDYGKWLIATLSLIHSAALYGLANMHNSPPKCAYIPFVVGLVAALGSGVMSWFNFTFVMNQYENWLEPKMLLDDSYWPKAKGRLNYLINATMWSAVVAGFVGLGCIPWGAWVFLNCRLT